MTSLSRLPGQVSDYFLVEAIVASTRTADSFKALDKFKRQSIGLWRSRAPLSVKSGQLAKFSDRVEQLSRIPGATEVLSYGVDASGFAFAVFPSFDGLGVLAGGPEGAEVERRYIAIVRLIDRLHSAGLVCEDLCLDSFAIDRSGTIRVLGIIGGFDGDAEGTISLPPVDSLRYFSPEQTYSFQADVFALGVLGYRMFSSGFPEDRSEDAHIQASDLANLNSKAPRWAPDVLALCLRHAREERPANAGAVLRAINESREKAAQEELSPALLDGAEDSRSPLRRQVSAVPIALTHQMGREKQAPPPPDQPKKKSFRIGLVGAVSGIGLVLVSGWMALRILRPAGVALPPTTIEVLPGDVSSGPLEGSGGPPDTAKFISRLVLSDDPLAHDALIRALREAKSPELRDFAWKAILDRSRRLGMIRSSDQLRSWIKSQGADFDILSIEGLVRCIDSGFPMEARIATLMEAYAKYPKLIMRVTAALALDFKQPEKFRDFLSTIAVNTSQIADARERGALAIMLLLPEMNTLFLDDIVAVAGQISDADLLWALAELAKRNAPQLQGVADLVLSRKIFEGPRRVFLEVLRRKSTLTPALTNALVRGSTDQLKTEDVATFDAWYDSDSSLVLDAAILSASDENIARAAFESLKGKPSSDRFMTKLVEFVRADYRENPLKIAKLLAAISLEEHVPESQFKEAFSELEELPKARELMILLMKSESSKVVLEVLARYSTLFNTTALLDLLTHRDKFVRITAIKQLTKANDIAALKLLLDGYDKEGDRDVRAAYEQYITVIQERRLKSRRGQQ